MRRFKKSANAVLIDHARVRAAVKAAFIHLGLSLVVAALTAAVMFGLWFPYPYRELAGGQHLFWIVIGVDVVCGPLLTSVLFNPAKSRRELTLDLSLVALVQLAALLYGLHSVTLARPVILAFETDRLVTVSAAEINTADLPLAPAGFQALSWTGPVLIGTRTPKDGSETLKSIELSTLGIEPSARPGWWQPYEKSRPVVRQRMKRLDARRAKLPSEKQAIIDEAAKKTGLPVDQLYYLPLVSKKQLDTWIALLDAQGTIKGYAPIDGFE
ncbi:TfpX/TfpZ family type IV pilin accessory protein [Ralstonia sp. 22111]|uniref:TfpX/TfpZ family type IV pilin accessory protein n=1 Tax=Ralstonia sp. 22111 TaxID=3453878 RepID=UPI003F824E91